MHCRHIYEYHNNNNCINYNGGMHKQNCIHHTWLKCHNKFDTKVKVQLAHSYTRTYFIKRIIIKKKNDMEQMNKK